MIMLTIYMKPNKDRKVVRLEFIETSTILDILNKQYMYAPIC